MQKEIRNFVCGFTVEEVNQVFRNYDDNCFDQWLINPHIGNMECRKKAIVDYLEQTLIWEDPCERQRKFLSCVTKKSPKKFISIICSDEYFSEPLAHTLDQGKRDYNLDYLVENNIITQP